MKVRCIDNMNGVLKLGKVYEVKDIVDNGKYYKIEHSPNIECRVKADRFEEVKENNNMKEITFKEVIASIKDGESYRAIYEKGLGNRPTITRNQNRIEIDFPLKTDCYLFTIDMLFELVRKTYTFEEAFKAFEEGKEIESCEGWKFKKKGDKVIVINHSGARFEESSTNALFSLKEMEGDWYINE